MKKQKKSRVVTSKPKPRKKKTNETELRKDRDRKREMRANLTEKERARLRQKKSDAARLRRANLSEEELTLRRQKDAERKRLKRAQLSGKDLSSNVNVPKVSPRSKPRWSQLNERQLALQRIKDAASKREQRANLTEEEKAICRKHEEGRRKERRMQLNEEQLALLRAEEAAYRRHYNRRLSESRRILRRKLDAKRVKDRKAETVESTILLFKGRSVEGKEQHTLEGQTSNVKENNETLLQIRRLKRLVTSLKEASVELIKSSVESKVGRLKGGKGLSQKETESRKNKQSNDNVKRRYKHRKPELNRHNEMFPIISVGDNRFVCIVCDDVLDTIFGIKGHLSFHTALELSKAKEKYALEKDSRNMHVVALTVYECEVCSDKSYSLPTYRKHLVENHKENVELLKKMCFPCSLCAETFVVKSALRTHQRHLHNIFTQCPDCSESFETQDLFAKHVDEKHVDCVRNGEMILEYDEGYFCKLCGVSSRSYSYVATHVKEAHSDISFECKICKLKFESKRNLVRHKHKFHEEKPLCCEICGERFINASLLRVHKRKHTVNSAAGIHTDGKVDCKLCGKILANKASLRVHHMAIHEEKQFQCFVCRKFFQCWSMLYRHRITVCEKEKSIPKPCPICGKIMENYISLHCHKTNIHKYGNTEETVCHVCNKTFKTSDNLLNHNRRCHGLNNIRRDENLKLLCCVCGKTLRSKPKLLDHWRLHRKEAPFKCSFCEKSFKCKYKFYRHKESAHENDQESAKLIINSEADHKIIADFNDAHADQFLKVAEANRTVESTTEAETNSSLGQQNDLSINEVIYNTDKNYVDFSRSNVPVFSTAHQRREEDNCKDHELITDDNIPKMSRLNQRNKDATVENELMESDDQLWETMEFSSPINSPLPETDLINSDSNSNEDEKPYIYPEGSYLEDPFPKRLIVEIERLKECLLCDHFFTSSNLYKQHLNSKKHRLALRTNKRETVLTKSEKKEYREQIGKEKNMKKIRKGKGKFSCPFCDEKLHSVSEYLKHTAKHKKKENCIICSENFPSVRKLVDHYILGHNGENVIKCDKCGMGFLNSFSLREHIKNMHTKIKRVGRNKNGSSCDVCGEKIKDFKSFKNHILSHENDKHKCVHCAAEFKVLVEFEQHYNEAHNGEMPFPCGECNKKFATQLRLQQHNTLCKGKDVTEQVSVERSVHIKEKLREFYNDNKKQLTCSFCNATYWNKEKFKAHMVQHNKRAMCLLCAEGFANVRKLVHHYGEVHNGEKLVRCEICDMSFLEYQPRNLRDHMADQHDIERRKNWRVLQTYSCDVCGVISEGKSHFKSHLLSHKKDKHKCVHCNAEVKGLEALEGHYNESHNGEMPFPCGECPLKFSIQRRLQLHQKEAHPDSNDTQSVQFGDNNELVYHKSIQDPLEATEKVFCEVCGKFFFGEASLTIHKREHTGEKPYQCTLCGMAFFSPAILKQHMNKDHKKACHPCDTCGKSFNRRQNLVKHSKTCFPAIGGQINFICDICSENCGKPEALERHKKFHDPARRFVCDICSFRYKYSSNLSNHKKSVHHERGTVIPKI